MNSGFKITEDGFSIADLGGNRNLIKPEVGEELLRALNALGKMQIEIVKVGKSKIYYSEGRILFQILASDITGSSASSTACYKIKSVSANHLVCRSWDGVNEGAFDVLVAKPHSARQPANETIAGTAYSYTYSAGPDSLNSVRESDDGDTTEDQIVTPLWVENGLIQVFRTNFSGVTVDDSDLKYIEVGPRCWAKIEPPA